MKKDKRVDAYIAKAPAFAKPVLILLRAAVHEGCPDVEETIRWSVPSFTYAGSPLCNIGAFKAHLRFVFWKAAEITHKGEVGNELFGNITNVADLLPKKEIVAIVKKAVKLTDALAADKKNPKATKALATKKPAKPPPELPTDFSKALTKNKKAIIAYANFSSSQKREYVEWVDGAKRAETRATRIEKATAQIADGKSLNWKYQ